jgi:hypothetical protein
VITPFDRGRIAAEALNEIGRVKHPLVFASAATERHERHFPLDRLSECSAKAMVASARDEIRGQRRKQRCIATRHRWDHRDLILRQTTRV